MTPIDHPDRLPGPPDGKDAPGSRRRYGWLSLAVFLASAALFAIGPEPHFIDESAYFAQSGYVDLMLDGKRDDPAWLEYAGYDLPPLPKYLIGLTLRLVGMPRPNPYMAYNWYHNTKMQIAAGSPLSVARFPSLILGGLGCVAILAIGTRALGRSAGLLAAALLAISPLYRLHARRAMSDVPAEAFMLVALTFGLAAWSAWMAGKGGWRPWLAMTLGAGVFAGLAVLSKLNGAIACMTLLAWAVLGQVLVISRGRSDPHRPFPKVLAMSLATITSCAVGFVTFVALNPFLTARPTGPIRPDLRPIADLSFSGRVRMVAQHRAEVSVRAREQFPDDALSTPLDRIKAVAVQGYGRFSPLGPLHSDSTRRFDRRQDWGAVVWLPLVLAGAGVTFANGRAQWRAGEPPTAWAVALAALVALIAVGSFIPLAWDRYYLSIQPGAVLFASAALAEIPRLLRRARGAA